MRKLKNNKGFTLIELLAVIVILAILVAVAVPAVTRYLDTARKGTFASNANAAISAVRNDVIAKGVTTTTVYNLAAINGLLDKQLKDSPYGKPYTANSYIKVTFATTGTNAGTPTYSICLVDDGGNGLYDAKTNAVLESATKDISVKTGLAADKTAAAALCKAE